VPRNIRRGATFGVRGGARGRLTEWFPSADVTGEASLAAGTFVFLQSLTAAELAKRPFTVTRTVGNIWVRSDQVAAQELVFGAIGFIVVSDKAIALGATAIPDPITQEGSDEWFAYRSFGIGADAGGLGSPVGEFAFDSRAQRKVADGEDIAVVVTNADATHGMQFVVKFRILVKLS